METVKIGILEFRENLAGYPSLDRARRLCNMAYRRFAVLRFHVRDFFQCSDYMGTGCF